MLNGVLRTAAVREPGARDDDAIGERSAPADGGTRRSERIMVFRVEHAATARGGAVAEIGRVTGRRKAYDAIEKLRDSPEALGASYHGRRAAFEQMQEELR